MPNKMSPTIIENELIKIFTSSEVHTTAGGIGVFLVEWDNYSMWLVLHPKHQNNKHISIYKGIELGKRTIKYTIPEIPTKALAILAITYRPAYEFYKKHWLK